VAMLRFNRSMATMLRPGEASTPAAA
jgi:hypothetical protein